MKKYSLTLIGLAVAVIISIGTIIFDLDTFEFVINLLLGFEKYEIDEFMIPIGIFFLFSYIDQVRRRRSQEIKVEKIKIYEAMLYSTHHILNNFLNQSQLIRMTAEDTPGFDPEVLSTYGETIEEASTKIKELGNIAAIDESLIRDSVAKN